MTAGPVGQHQVVPRLTPYYHYKPSGSRLEHTRPPAGLILDHTPSIAPTSTVGVQLMADPHLWLCPLLQSFLLKAILQEESPAVLIQWNNAHQ